MKYEGEEEVRAALIAATSKLGSSKRLAITAFSNTNCISRMRNGHTAINERVAKALGYEIVKVYRKIETNVFN